MLGALANNESKTESEAGVVLLAPVSEAGALGPLLGLSAKFFRVLMSQFKKHMYSTTRRLKRGDSPTQYLTLPFPLLPTSIPIQSTHNPMYRVLVRLSDIGPADTTAAGGLGFLRQHSRFSC